MVYKRPKSNTTLIYFVLFHFFVSIIYSKLQYRKYICGCLTTLTRDDPESSGHVFCDLVVGGAVGRGSSSLFTMMMDGHLSRD